LPSTNRKENKNLNNSISRRGQQMLANFQPSPVLREFALMAI